MIATAFSYKLEDIYAMDYETFLFRLAQAEAKLLTMGVIKEPFVINDGSVIRQEKPEKPRTRVDAKKAWEQQRAVKLNQTPTNKAKGKWWEVSPVLESDQRKPINFTAEKQATDDLVLDTHERAEKGAMRQHLIEKKLAHPRAKMIEDAKIIYRDLIATLQGSKK